MFAFSQVIFGTLCLGTDLASRNKSIHHESSEPMGYLAFVLKNTLGLKKSWYIKNYMWKLLNWLHNVLLCDKRLTVKLFKYKARINSCVTLCHRLSLKRMCRMWKKCSVEISLSCTCLETCFSAMKSWNPAPCVFICQVPI